MSFVVSQAISDCQQRSNTVGQRLADADFILFLNDALNYFSTNLKLPTSYRKWGLVAYPGVREYPLPADFISIISPQRPAGLHSPNFEHTTEKDMYHWPYGLQTAIGWDRETPYLNFNETNASQSLVNGCNSTDNWSVAGDGSSLLLDNQIFSEGTGSLRFLVTAATGATTLTCSSMPAVDLTSFLVDGRAFLDLFAPDTNSAALTSIVLRLGTDASNYYEMTATTRQRGNALMGGRGLVGFDLYTKTTVGTPTDTNISWLQVVVNHGLAGVDGVYRLDNIFLSQGVYYEVPYYSKYNVKSAAGAYKQRVTVTDDTILCPDDLDEAIQFKMLEIASAIRLKDTAKANYFARELKPKEVALRMKYPTAESLIQTSYYKKANRF